MWQPNPFGNLNFMITELGANFLLIYFLRPEVQIEW